MDRRARWLFYSPTELPVFITAQWFVVFLIQLKKLNKPCNFEPPIMYTCENHSWLRTLTIYGLTLFQRQTTIHFFVNFGVQYFHKYT